MVTFSPQSIEILKQKIVDMDRSGKSFGMLRAQIAELIARAPYDPLARKRLQQLEQAWVGGIQQQAEKMQQQMKIMHARIQIVSDAMTAEMPGQSGKSSGSRRTAADQQQSETPSAQPRAPTVRKVRRFC
jgi:hypothetical protein